jgi:hypothetical protein
MRRVPVVAPNPGVDVAVGAVAPKPNPVLGVVVGAVAPKPNPDLLVTLLR